MNRRAIILVLVAALIAVLVVWIARHLYWEEIDAPAPLRGEALTNPFYSAQRLVEHLGARSEPRHRLGALSSAEHTIFLRQWHWSLIEPRRLQLEAWVEAGGRLVIEGPLVGGEDQLRAWAGLGFEQPQPRAADDPDAQQEAETDESATGQDDAPAANDDASGCRELEVTSGGSALNAVGGRYEVCPEFMVGWLTSEREPQWALSDERGLQALRVPVGQGSVTLLNVHAFGNRELLEAQHARLLADALQLRRGDHVVFASEEEHASLLELIWKHGAPIVILLALLIGAALWRGAVRFGPMQAPPDLSRRSLAEQIRGTGHFVLRAGGGRTLHAAMVRAIHEAAARRIPHYARAPVSERLAMISSLVGVDGDELAASVNAGDALHGHELKRTLLLLAQVRERLEHKK